MIQFDIVIGLNNYRILFEANVDNFSIFTKNILSFHKAVTVRGTPGYSLEIC